MRDFYEHQDNAYQRTGRLILLLSTALFGTVVVTGMAIAYLLVLALCLLAPELELGRIFLAASVVTTTLAAMFVAGTSFHKLMLLRDGGAVIAVELGGTLVSPGSRDLDQRKILNVVEEMAIASGIPVPPVYLLDQEGGVNAFAAGYSPQDAVIGVTRGCITRLTRDQLQGVVAHEFSHILNGDMRMNLRIIGILHGILAITILAEKLIQHGIELIEHCQVNRDTTLPGVALIVAGAMLWPIGLAGVFFGVLIKAAMNRQREYLADASAVEFTRNPEGIAGALKVIGGYAAGSRVRNPVAAEASHIFFAQGHRGIGRLLATHPPLEQRIHRIDPTWDGVPIFEDEAQVEPYQGAYEDTLNFFGGQTGGAALGGAATAERCRPADPVEKTETVDEDAQPAWQCSASHTDDVRQSVPAQLVELAGDADGACAVLYVLWLSGGRGCPEEPARELDPAFQEVTTALLAVFEDLDSAQRLLLMDVALQALDSLTAEQRRLFKANVARLVAAVDVPTTFQWVWQRMIRRRQGGGGNESRPKARHGSLQPVQAACEVLLSALVYSGGNEGMTAQYTFERGAVHLDISDPLLRDRQACEITAVGEALDVLAHAAPRARRRLLLACATCITADREVTDDEAYLIRGICAALNYPVPELFPGQPVLPGA